MQENNENYDASAAEVSYGAAIRKHHLQVATVSSSICRRGLATSGMAEEGPQGEQKLALLMYHIRFTFLFPSRN